MIHGKQARLTKLKIVLLVNGSSKWQMAELSKSMYDRMHAVYMKCTFANLTFQQNKSSVVRTFGLDVLNCELFELISKGRLLLCLWPVTFSGSDTSIRAGSEIKTAMLFFIFRLSD